MKVLTSLKELFTFDPDPQGVEINRVGDVAVANYALREAVDQRHRAETCKCGSCKQALKEAEARVEWATSYPVCVIRKGKRAIIQYSDGSQGELGENE